MTYEEALETKLRMCDICRNEAKPTKAACENCSDKVAIDALKNQELYRKKINELIELIDDMSKSIRERHIDDDVCGLCEYDGNHFIGPSGDYLQECPGFERDDCFCMSEDFKSRYIDWSE